MNISFTGINNINLKTKTTTEPTILRSQDGSQMKLDTRIREIDLECVLTDDEKGANLTDFYGAMYQSKVLCTNRDNPNFVHIKTVEMDDPIRVRMKASGESVLSMQKSIAISINDESVKLNELSHRNYLHLLTFIAHLTSKLSKQETLTEEQKKQAKEMNEITQVLGEHFIDKVM